MDYTTLKEKIKLAGNPSTPKEILKILSLHQSWFVRSAVAGNPNTDPEVLKVLSGDIDLDVLCKVASNPSTPLDVLMKFAMYRSPWMRDSVIENPKATEELIILAKATEFILRNH
jgi:hypothetical protein